jgi:hypothetical protein
MKKLTSLLQYSLPLIFIGCVHHDYAYSGKGVKADRIEILTTVLRDMGASSPRKFFWLNLPDSDFERVDAQFANAPPGYRYGRWERSISLGDTQMLTVRVEQISQGAASVSATYSGDGYFSEYTYKLVRTDGRWHVASREPLVAS